MRVSSITALLAVACTAPPDDPATDAGIVAPMEDSGTPAIDAGPPVTDVWTCDAASMNDGTCTCGCGAVDPDCDAGAGCTEDGCRAEGCAICMDAGAPHFCFDFCAECATDADCPGGVCAPDPDGPGIGFCTASCDLTRCGSDEDPRALCGADGNCLTASGGDEVCADDLTRGGRLDGCGNFVAPVVCAAGLHCALLGEGSADGGGRVYYAFCLPGYSDGTPSSDPRLCEGGMIGSHAWAPDVTWCTRPCAAEADCGEYLHCRPDTFLCAPDTSLDCGPDPTVLYSRDAFGNAYPALNQACDPGETCVDGAGWSLARCRTLRGDGQTCTTSAQCDGGVCRTVPDATSIFFCSRPCASDSACVPTMRCSPEGTCVPRRTEECSSDGRRRISVDAFGRTYGTIQTCPLDLVCSEASGVSACDRQRCDQESGCECYGGFCTCCSPEYYAPDTNQCCRTCDSEGECRAAP
jgi:hypothetical protein